MDVALRHRIMRIEDFLAWEARQETRFEFDGIEPVAMAGGSVNHSTIQRNLAMAIGGRLRGRECAFHGSDLKVVTSDRVRYPDGQVICGKTPGRATFTTTPTVLFEVVSPDSDVRDRSEKHAEYCAMSSVQRHVVLEQDQISLSVTERVGPDWRTRVLGAADLLVMPEIGLEVPVVELYEGVDLEP